MPEPLFAHGVVALYPVYLQTQALAFERLVPMPGTLRAFEHQQSPHRWRYFHGVVFPVLRAQQPQAPASSDPLRVQVKKHGENLIARIRVDSPIGSRATLPAYRHPCPILAQIETKFASDRVREVLAAQFLNQVCKRRSILQGRQWETASAVDLRKVAPEGVFAARLQHVIHQHVVERLVLQGGLLETLQVQHPQSGCCCHPFPSVSAHASTTASHTALSRTENCRP